MCIKEKETHSYPYLILVFLEILLQVYTKLIEKETHSNHHIFEYNFVLYIL